MVHYRSKGKRSLSHILTKQRNEFIKLDQTLVALIEANLTEIEIYQDRDLLIKGRFTNYVNSRASQASRGRNEAYRQKNQSINQSTNKTSKLNL